MVRGRHAGPAPATWNLELATIRAAVDAVGGEQELGGYEGFLADRCGEDRGQHQAGAEGGAGVHPGDRAQAVGRCRWGRGVLVSQGRRSRGDGAAPAQDARLER